MTASEEQKLRALQADLAQAEQGKWEPRCVCDAFATNNGGLVLTMQGWIDLEAVKSPLLYYQLPDGEDTVAQLSAAVDAFRCGPLEKVKPESAVALGNAMIEAVREAFSLQIAMDPPGKSQSRPPGGFGRWLPIFACLIGQLKMSRFDALATPVKQAFGLIAAHRHNQGWLPATATYAQRDAALETEATNG